nr:putative L protein [Styphnolobium-associated cytorhabdovirus]
MDSDWLQGMFGDFTLSHDADRSVLEELLGGGPTKHSTNMTGLGDFHLRSAVKQINIERLQAGRCRFRENTDYNNFRECYGRDKIISGDPSILLSYFCIMRDSIVKDSGLLKCVSMRRAEKEIGVHSLRRRILMEISRDYCSGDVNEISPFRKAMLESTSMENVMTSYSDVRSATELMVMTSSNIASKRMSHPHIKDTGILLKDNNQVPLMMIVELGNMIICLGGDLMFVMFKYNSNVIRDVRDAGDITRGIISQHLGKFPEVFGDYIVEMTSKGVWHCYSCDVLKMINDKMSERDIVLRNAQLGSLVLPAIYPMPHLIERLFLSGDVLLSVFGSSGYKAIKCYEAIFTGVLLSRCDAKILDNSEFLRNTQRELIEELPEYEWVTDEWIEIANLLTSDHHVAQMYGLYRLWGHPTVDSKEGLQKVKRIGTAQKNINEEVAHQAGVAFKEQIYCGYYKRWGRYPVFRLNVPECELEHLLDSSYLISCLANNVAFDSRKDVYLPSDWDLVVSQKTFDLPETFNLTMVVDDKAISPPKSYLISVAKKYEKFMNPFERRGVLKWMNEDYMECKEFLQKINDTGLDEDDCVIGLYPKERELNSVPRMFSLMSAKMRNYVVVTEHMIADDILPFFPQITMMDDLLNLTKKIHGATRSQMYSTRLTRQDSRVFETTVCLNMDFEKWNLNMRRESTLPVFTEMGRLYGMDQLFNRTYDIFYNSYIYVCDDSFELKLENDKDGKIKLKCDGVSSYTNHVGGFEGLRQKGWTIFTVSVISMILRDFPITYKLMGQGDNQVLMMKLKTNKTEESGEASPEGVLELRALLSSIVDKLEKTFLELGLPLKTLESWRSERFFLYGKYPVKEGLPLSMSLKRLSRSFPFSNEDGMTIDNILGSIFTNAQAASMSDVSHIPSYYSGLLETLWGASMTLTWHPFTGKEFIKMLGEKFSWETFENIQGEGHRKSKRIKIEIEGKTDIYLFAEAICMFPKSLGGSNGITEYEFVMRGFPDNQSRDLTYLIEIISANKNSSDSQISKLVDCLLNFTKISLSNSANLDFLVEDPCATNLLQPKTPQTVLRMKIKNVPANNVSFKNKHFMDLFKLSRDENRRELLNKLAEGDRLFPRVLHDCYAASLFGFVDGIVSKVDKTVTVQRMCLELSDEDLIKGMCNVEDNYMGYLYWRCEHFRATRYEGEPKLKCPTNYIRWARNFGWKKEIEGVTVPYPGHTLKYHGETCPLSCDMNNVITCHISDFTPTNMDILLTTLGQSPPYLGSYTKEKMKSYDRVALYSSEPLIRRVVRMMRLIGWGSLEESNLHKYLSKLLSSICDADEEIFLMNKEDIGGSIEHRYRDSSLKHGALASNMYGLSTWLHMSTDNFGEFTKGSKNVTLHFQAMLCWIQTRVYEKLLSRCMSPDSDIKEFHFHLQCRECIKSVEYDIPDIVEIPDELVPSLKDNPYCFVKDIMLTEKDRSIYAVKDLLNLRKEITVDSLSPRERRHLFHETWASAIASDILSEGSDLDLHVGTQVLEISKYPRIAFHRVDVKLLLDIVCEILLLKVFQEEEQKDKYKETSLSFTHAEEVLQNKLSESISDNFIGLGILFSWENKLEEILEICPFLLPDATAMSVSDCLLSGKRLIITYVQSKESWFEESCRYINLSEHISLETATLLRYASYFKFEDPSSCPECRRCICKGISPSNLFSLSGKEKCSNGHLWFHKEYISKNVKIICIPEDALSKSQSDVYLTKVPSGRMQIDDISDLSTSLAIMRRKPSSFKIFSSEHANFTSGMTIPEGRLTFQGARDPMRICYRCVPSDLSAGYRLLDLLVELRVTYTRSNRYMLNIGDGTGNAGFLLNKLTGKKMMNATLVDCTKSFPQTFPSSRPVMQFLSSDKADHDNSLTKLLINNIFSESVVSIYKEVCKKKKITIGHCDIELEHDEFQSFNTSAGSFPYSKLITQIGKIPLEVWIVKLRVIGNLELYHIMETLMTECRRYELFITPYCNSLKGEFYVVMHDTSVKKDSDRTRMIDSKTRLDVLSKFDSYMEGKMFQSLDHSYYYASNAVMLSDGLLPRAVKKVEEWIKAPRLNIDMSMKNMTSFYYSVAAARNPKAYIHHGDKKVKFEYYSDLQAIGERIFALGVSKISSESVVCATMDTMSSYLVARPSCVLSDGDTQVITKYTYCVISRKEYQNRLDEKSEWNWSYLKPIALKASNAALHHIPMMRIINLKHGILQDARYMDSVEFTYLSAKALNKKRDNQILLHVSKSCNQAKISK